MQEDQYTKEFEIRWGDIDANRHVTNIAYSEYFVHTRFSFLKANKLDQKWFEEHKLGPAVLHDEIFYLKEISPDEKIKVNIMLDGRTEDYIAMLRKEREYKNVLLVEQPNTNFAYTIGRQFLFDVFHYTLLSELQKSTDLTLSSIAKKCIKEVSYHVRFSSDWVKRLGDGTEESREKMQNAIDDLWAYTDELFHQTEADKAMATEGIGVDVTQLKEDYYKSVSQTLEAATLVVPDLQYFQKGGKQGIHTEHMGYLLADLQYMQRTYPNMEW